MFDSRLDALGFTPLLYVTRQLSCQSYDTNFGDDANGEPVVVDLEAHVAGVAYLAGTVADDFNFKDYTIMGSTWGPKNTIIVPGQVGDKLKADLKALNTKTPYLTYKVKGKVGSTTRITTVRLYHSRVGMGAPGTKVEKT